MKGEAAALFDALVVHARADLRPALSDGRATLSFAALLEAAEAFAAALDAARAGVLATLFDNGPAWVAADLGALRAGVVHVPLPAFFTAEQTGHVLASAGVDALLTTPALATRFGAASAGVTLEVAGQKLVLLRRPAAPPRLPAGTVRITFTSGSTGTPKGVCLGADAMLGVAAGVAEATAALDVRRHLCVLPLPVLLENVAGVYAPLLLGATVVLPPLAEVGLAGSSVFDAGRFRRTLEAERPHSLILLPQMLRAWVARLQTEALRAPASLRLVAVGGAAVGAPLLAAARALGIPAFEGYGLSEGASVQCLNLPGGDRPGSAGRPLPHARLRVAADGELEIGGTLFLGYLGEAAAPAEWWPSGDLGTIDADGFVHLHGRKKNLLITAFGRNVSPEWVESALCAQPAIAQAVVLGDGEPALGAVLWPSSTALPDAALAAAVEAANAGLPDYARIGPWERARAAFSAEAGLATANGRPLRAAIARLHADALGFAAAPSLPSPESA